jgi:hypothetical protein
VLSLALVFEDWIIPYYFKHSFSPYYLLPTPKMIYDSTFAGAAVSFILFFSSLNGVDAGKSVKAVPAIQNLNRRAIYQGGWPLALLGSASTTCPDEAPVKCASKSLNPACCPGGQTCIYGSGPYANYCCPTSTSHLLSFSRSISSPILSFSSV